MWSEPGRNAQQQCHKWQRLVEERRVLLVGRARCTLATRLRLRLLL